MTEELDPTVCVVDDDEAVRGSLKATLESRGMRVRVFASAIEFLERHAFRNCRCLILDLHMPIMSGLELLETLRARDIGVPTVMVTGLPDSRLALRLENVGFSTLLAKPVRETELFDGIANAVLASVR